MGLGSFIKKSVKNAFRGGSAWGLVEKATKPITDQVRGALGLNAFADIASSQDAQLRAQQQAMQLQQANEVSNIVQFEDGGTNLGGTSDMRKRKQSTGAFGSGLGLNA